jgi:hypothetical protein
MPETGHAADLKSRAAATAPALSLDVPLPFAERVPDDLPGLRSEAGLSAAAHLGVMLMEIRYHELAPRFTEQKCDPRAAAAFGENLLRRTRQHLITENAEQGLVRNVRERCVVDLCWHGKAVTEEALAALAGERCADFITCGRESGLLIPAGEGWRLNGVQIYTDQLFELPFYFAGDLEHTNSAALGIERAYIGPDSSLFSEFACDFARSCDCDLSCVVEAGGGMQNNLITLLAQHDLLRLAAGRDGTLAAANHLKPNLKVVNWEIDARARNLGGLNCIMNGISPDRITPASTPAELRRLVGPGEITLALSNPPFFAVPMDALIPKEERGLLPPGVVPFEVAGELRVNLRQVFPTPGWGGPCGLSVTAYFLEVLDELMAPGGQMLILSDFAGKGFAPTKIKELLARFPRVEVVMEKPLQFPFQIQEQAAHNREVLAACYPQLQGSRFLAEVEAETIKTAQREDYTHLFSRFMALRWR